VLDNESRWSGRESLMTATIVARNKLAFGGFHPHFKSRPPINQQALAHTMAGAPRANTQWHLAYRTQSRSTTRLAVS
jgi:hypothetical protein